jgi:hypothetical protein
MVGDLVWSYPLIGMKREKVYDLMGAGSEGSGVPNRESYDLGEKHIAMCGNAIDYYGLIVNYNDQSELQSLQLRHMGLTFPVQVSSTITVNPGSDTKPDTMHSGTASTETGDQ